MNKIIIQVVVCILIAFFIIVKPTSSNTKARLGSLLHSFFAGFMYIMKSPLHISDKMNTLRLCGKFINKLRHLLISVTLVIFCR